MQGTWGLTSSNSLDETYRAQHVLQQRLEVDHVPDARRHLACYATTQMRISTDDTSIRMRISTDDTSTLERSAHNQRPQIATQAEARQRWQPAHARERRSWRMTSADETNRNALGSTIRLQTKLTSRHAPSASSFWPANAFSSSRILQAGNPHFRDRSRGHGHCSNGSRYN